MSSVFANLLVVCDSPICLFGAGDQNKGTVPATYLAPECVNSEDSVLVRHLLLCFQETRARKSLFLFKASLI